MIKNTIEKRFLRDTEMEIDIKKMGNIIRLDKKFPNNKKIKLEIKENSTVADVLEELGIPRNYVTLIIINNKTASLDTELQNGDKIILFPPMGGG